MSHCVAGGILPSQPGKIRSNCLSCIGSTQSQPLDPQGSPFYCCCFLTFGVFCPALLIFNQFLDQTLTLHEQSIPWSDFDTIWVLHQQTATGWKRTLHSTFYPFSTQLWISPTQDQTLFFRADGMLECRKERIEDWIIMIGLSTQVLLSSSPGLCHPIAHLSSTSTTQAGDEYFFPRKQRKPVFTPAQWLSTRNWLPWGYLTNVWIYFWLSWLREGVITGTPVDRGRGCCCTFCNVQVSSSKKTCLVQMSAVLRLRKPASVPL